MNFSKKNHEHHKTNRIFVSKTKILLLFIFISLFSLHAKEIENNTLEKGNNTIVKNNDVYVMDAALVDPYGKAYFFVGKFYHKYNTSSKKLEKRSLIASSTDGFNRLISNIDAAFIHPQNKRGYIFKGTVYYRYNFKTKKIEKEGIISNGFKGLQGPFDAALVHPTNNSAYFFKDKKYYRYSFSKKKVDKVGVIGTDGWKGIPKNADAALIHSNGKAYFFKDDTYYRYDFTKRKMDKKAAIKKGWKGLFKNIDAAEDYIPDSNYRSEFFRSSYRYYVDEDTPSDENFFLNVPWTNQKEKISKKYKGIPSNIDAVLTHPKNKKKYFFIQGQYFRYNETLNKVEKIGTIGHDGWKGVPVPVDAAFVHKNGKAYFFKGAKYYRFNFNTHKVDKVALIKDGFKGVPDNIDAAKSNGNVF